MTAKASSKATENFKSDITSLMNYIIVLIKQYPNGITQKELATLVSVTPGAVSKIKDKLFPLCVVKSLAYESKIILKPNIIILEEVVKDLARQTKYLRALTILSTEYAEEAITKRDIYKIASDRLPFLPLIFTKEEFELGAKIMLRYIRSFTASSEEIAKTEKIVEYVQSQDFSEAGGENLILGLLMGKVIRTDLDWPIETEPELEIAVGIRDKIFYLIKDFFGDFTDGLSILDDLPTEDQILYKNTYRHTTDFYLKKIFALITTALELSAKKKNIAFPEKFKEIGKNTLG